MAVYLDDIIVFSKTFTKHIENLSQVLKCLQQTHLKLSPEKCHLFRKQVTYLGHVVSSEGVGTDQSKVEAMMIWPVPKNVKQVKSFLG